MTGRGVPAEPFDRAAQGSGNVCPALVRCPKRAVTAAQGSRRDSAGLLALPAQRSSYHAERNGSNGVLTFGQESTHFPCGRAQVIALAMTRRTFESKYVG